MKTDFSPFASSSYIRFLVIFLIIVADVVHQINAYIEPATSIPEGYTSYSSLNTAYKFYNEKLTWYEAKSRCKLEGARLAVIDTYEKVRYVGELKPLLTYVWVGISRESRGSPWLTDDSSMIISYLPWAPGQPSCFNNCIAVAMFNRGVSNENCNFRKGFVCERPMLVINPRFGRGIK